MSLNDTLIGEGATEWWLSTIRKGGTNVKKEKSKTPKSKKLVGSACIPAKRGRKSQIKKDI